MVDSSTPETNNYAELVQQYEALDKQVQTLTQRVEKLESQLVLIPDIDKYGKLQDCLAKGDFKAADHETTRIILETLNRNRDNLAPESLSILPCTVLTVIDRVWRNYSEEKFGFSNQLATYQKVGGSMDTLRTQDRKVMGAFAQEVGWVKEGKLRFEEYDQWDFSLNAPEGSFPAIWWKSPYGLKMVTFFFIRLFECNI